MLHDDHNPPLENAYDLLYQLGLTATCISFFYTSYAIWLAAKEPERLTLVSKWLYPDVASHYKTNWKVIESALRRVITRVWKKHPDLLSEWAEQPLSEKPKPAQFIAILSRKI